MYNNKKGQAALEFLMTYGWAILAAIIVIGALGSYFYFNQGGSTSIFVNAPFYGVAAAAATDGVISLEIQNKGGETLENVYVNITNSNNGPCAQNTTGFDETDSTPQIITVSCAAGTGSFTGDIEVQYQRPGSSLPLTATGSVSAPLV